MSGETSTALHSNKIRPLAYIFNNSPPNHLHSPTMSSSSRFPSENTSLDVNSRQLPINSCWTPTNATRAGIQNDIPSTFINQPPSRMVSASHLPTNSHVQSPLNSPHSNVLGQFSQFNRYPSKLGFPVVQPNQLPLPTVPGMFPPLPQIGFPMNSTQDLMNSSFLLSVINNQAQQIESLIHSQQLQRDFQHQSQVNINPMLSDTFNQHAQNSNICTNLTP